MTSRDTVDLLRKARALIEKPEAWTKHALARDASGNAVPPHYKRAVRFCVEGALRRAIAAVERTHVA